MGDTMDRQDDVVGTEPLPTGVRICLEIMGWSVLIVLTTAVVVSSAIAVWWMWHIFRNIAP